jgi:hypothetical protein
MRSARLLLLLVTVSFGGTVAAQDRNIVGVRGSVKAANETFKCLGYSERCVVPLAARTDYQDGVPFCSLRADFDQLRVAKSKIGKQIRIVFMIVNGDVGDDSVYRFRPSQGIVFKPMSPDTNDVSTDFSRPDADSADGRRYKWNSVYARKASIKFNINVERYDPKTDHWDNCEPTDPTISNID